MFHLFREDMLHLRLLLRRALGDQLVVDLEHQPGRGPLLHIKMQSVGSSSAHFENAFASAGINQTRHEIRLVVDVYVSVLLPGFSTVTKVTNRCAVAETVIVGSVPDTYTYFDTREDMSSTAEDFIMNNAG